MKNLTLILCTAAICATWIYTANVGRYENTTTAGGLFLTDTKTGAMYVLDGDNNFIYLSPINKLSKQTP
jgi:hypothetical protein